MKEPIRSPNSECGAQSKTNRAQNYFHWPRHGHCASLSRTRITCVAYHLPPADVGTPRAFNSSAAFRADLECQRVAAVGVQGHGAGLELIVWLLSFLWRGEFPPSGLFCSA
jgi:hypothetical protein